MADPVVIRQGQTVTFEGVWTPIAGGPATLAGAVVTSAVEDDAGAVTYGAVVVAVNNLDFTISYTPTQTALFALGPMQTDVKFIFSPTVTFTTKGHLIVTDTVTK
jgi:hypothetical protein